MSITKTCTIENCNRKMHGLQRCVYHYQQFRKSADYVKKVAQSPKGEPLDFYYRKYSINTEKCILWPYQKSNGYGRVIFNNKKIMVHRLSLIQYSGEDHKELFALHSCRNRNCFNPTHLRWGTHKENMEDMVADGTSAQGTKHYHAKLSEKDVIKIYLDTRTHVAIAKDYNMNPSNVSHIKTGRAWRNVTKSIL